jgi:hypothetical protein
MSHIKAAPNGAGAPTEVIVLDARQVRDGREALRDWLACGRDSLSVSDRSLDMALRTVIAQVFRREIVFSASSPPRSASDQN